VVTLLCSEEEENNQQMVQTENGCHEDVFLSGTTFYVNGDFFYSAKKNCVSYYHKK
jgi:hypothetical protein